MVVSSSDASVRSTAMPPAARSGASFEIGVRAGPAVGPRHDRSTAARHRWPASTQLRPSAMYNPPVAHMDHDFVGAPILNCSYEYPLRCQKLGAGGPLMNEVFAGVARTARESPPGPSAAGCLRDRLGAPAQSRRLHMFRAF